MLAAFGDLVDSQRGTWLVRPSAAPVPALGTPAIAVLVVLLGVAGRRWLANVRVASSSVVSWSM